jgi:peptidylprolyl isomerase
MQLRETRGVVRVVAGFSVLVAALGLLAGIAGCGGGGSSDASAQNAGEPIPDSRPKLEVPEGLPPKKLVVKELSKGTGAEAEKGDKVSLQYYCIVWENGAEYANSWRYPSVPTFVLGKHLLLRGLTLAVPGMKEGGGREVLIPNTLVYYPEISRSRPPLGRLAALICKVYLVKVLDKKR